MLHCITAREHPAPRNAGGNAVKMFVQRGDPGTLLSWNRAPSQGDASPAPPTRPRPPLAGHALGTHAHEHAHTHTAWEQLAPPGVVPALSGNLTLRAPNRWPRGWSWGCGHGSPLAHHILLLLDASHLKLQPVPSACFAVEMGDTGTRGRDTRLFGPCSTETVYEASSSVTTC